MVNQEKFKALSMIENAEVVFWDFDGVIKESAELKMMAYTELFGSISQIQKKEIINIYKDAGGLSRFKLIPILFKHLYKREISENELKNKIDSYSKLVISEVINSDYVEGIESFLKLKHKDQVYVITTNTPQEEILEILTKLNIRHLFDGVYGSPNTKIDAITDWITKYQVMHNKCVLIGDSDGDAVAAKAKNIKFIYRSISSKSLYPISIKNFLR